MRWGLLLLRGGAPACVPAFFRDSRFPGPRGQSRLLWQAPFFCRPGVVASSGPLRAASFRFTLSAWSESSDPLAADDPGSRAPLSFHPKSFFLCVPDPKRSARLTRCSSCSGQRRPARDTPLILPLLPRSRFLGQPSLSAIEAPNGGRERSLSRDSPPSRLSPEVPFPCRSAPKPVPASTPLLDRGLWFDERAPPLSPFRALTPCSLSFTVTAPTAQPAFASGPPGLSCRNLFFFQRTRRFNLPSMVQH